MSERCTTPYCGNDALGAEGFNVCFEHVTKDAALLVARALRAENEHLKRVADQWKEVAHRHDSYRDGDLAEIDRLRAENERLREVIRETHNAYCTADYTARGLHAPGCLLWEVVGD